MGRRTINENKSFTIYTTFIGEDQVHIIASVKDKYTDPARICKEIYRRITDTLTQMKMQIVHERLFGSVYFQADILKAREKIMRESGYCENLPVTYIQGQPIWGKGSAGIQIHAIHPHRPGENVWTICEDKISRGRGWKRNGATFLMLQNVHGLRQHPKAKKSQSEQTSLMFDRINRLLRTQGAEFKNVVRTWIYLSDILDWYPEFNQVRNAKFRQYGLISNSTTKEPHAEQIYLPASTGIQGENPYDAACIMDVLAVIQDSNSSLKVEHTTGVKQKSPFRYGSAFSRAMSIREHDVTHILLSGTAAIDDQGKSLFPGDTRAQILKTIEIVEALITQKGASLQDICDATVFLKNPEDISIYRKAAIERGLAEMPAVCVVADVCRHELLFELDAVVAIENNNQ